MDFLIDVWNSYSSPERRNILIYVGGIMLYKFGLEFFTGSITALASDRFGASAFTKLGAAQGINQAAQCVGAILIAPMTKHWSTRAVLAGSVLLFGLMTAILLIVDVATGGKIKPAIARDAVYGSWNPDAIFVVWTLAGVAYGMVELIRRVIPADIIGGHVGKLRRMDATHICYEVAGTAGAFASSSAISRFGNNYSFFLSPVFFAMAGAVWYYIGPLGQMASRSEVPLEDVERPTRHTGLLGYLVMVWRGFVQFVGSVWLGTKLVFSHRRFIWLLPGYALALYLHRFLEGGLAPPFAKVVLGESAWNQIIVGGSNFGELLGATAVFCLSDSVTTPLPWLRLDALMLNLIWLLPLYSRIATKDVKWAWIVAVTFIPISFGWAAGDVSIVAYIQASLADQQYGTGVSALGALMAFLYSAYIVMNAILSALLGRVIDNDASGNGNIYSALRRVGGIQFSVCSAIILAASFIPRNGVAWNPKVLEESCKEDPADTPESEMADAMPERSRPSQGV